VFTYAQAVAAGLSPSKAKQRIASGAWVRVAGRAFTLRGIPITAHREVQAVLLTWPDGVICLSTALRLVRAFPPPPDPELIHVAVPHPRRRQGRLVPHGFKLDRDSAWNCGGMPVQDDHQALADCLALWDKAQADAMFARIVVTRAAHPGLFAAAVQARRGRTGQSRVRRYSEMLAHGQASELEALLHSALIRAGITEGWCANQAIRAGGQYIGTFDILFPAAKLVIEADGRAYHSAGAAFQADRDRGNQLMAAGYRLLRFTWQDLIQREAEVIAQIRAALA
jgi:very-short-patch-repair endonuclease